VKRVCITGVGLISSLGVGREAHLPLGPGLRDAENFAPFSIHRLPALGMETVIPRREYRQMENFQRLGTYAAGLAIADADATALVAGMDLVVAAGGGERDWALDETIQAELLSIPPETREAWLHQKLADGLRPTLFLAQLPNLLAGSISIVHNVAGSSRTLMGEEGAGAEAIRVAAARIAAGTAEMVLVGAGFIAERWDVHLVFAAALHRGPWCPAAERQAMVLGSQAGFLLLESEAHARARGVRILAALSNVRVDAERSTAPAAGLCVAPFAGAGEMLADTLGAGLEAAFPVGVALAALRVAEGAATTPVHGFGHAYGAFSALVEPAP
jgi:3-oxoacyl-[acyl-carrier-protein] synthase II